MSRVHRSTVLSCAGTILLAGLLVYGFVLVWDSARGELHPPLLHSEYDDRLDTLDREAIDNAYRDTIARLFASWMKDTTVQPQRALNGARQARKAYIDSMHEIDSRKHINE
jgi:hypothetical protein